MRWSEAILRKTGIEKLAIRRKMFTLFYLVVTIAVAVVGYYGYQSARDAYRQHALAQVVEKTDDASRSTMDLLSLVANDMNFISSYYGLTRYLYWQDLKVPGNAAIWKSSTTDAFEAFMRNYDYLYKIRFLDNNGTEVISIRSDRATGEVHVEKGRNLQDRRHEAYFSETYMMEEDGLYTSPLDLNREYGKIEKPHIPVLRYARPVYGANHVKYGVAVINIYADYFLSFVRSIDEGSDGNYLLISEDGFYYYNPDAEKSWGHLLGHHVSFASDYPEIFASISGKEGGLIELDNKVISFTKIYPNPQDKTNYWYLVGMIDEDVVLAQLNQFVTISAIIFVMTLLLVFISGRLTINSLLSPLITLTRQMQRLSQGELRREEIDYRADDEISAMLKSSDSVIANLEALTTQVDTISSGDYSQQVHVLSDKDKLSMAINNMTATLKKNREENETREWLSDGLTQLTRELSGENNLQQLAEKAVSFIGRYVDAGHGVIYLYSESDEGETLDLLGSYMFTERASLSSHYKLGEGAIGQVARERKAILLKDIPKERKISTGTTSETPLNTFTFPLIYEGGLCGVVEFASFEPFTELKQQFFDESASIIASLIYMAIQSGKISTLLKVSEEKSRALQQSNTQMEEQQQQLQQQTEELQQTNAQMEEQQQQLQQQTEELQQTNAQMEEQQQQLQMQTEELQESKEALTLRAEQLELSNKYKSEFLANMSHELRTPLNSVILLSKMMMRNENGHLDDEDVKRANVIHHSGNELLRLINDILDLSKVEAGKFELIQESFDSTQLLDELRSQFEDSAKNKGLSLIVDDRLHASLNTDKNKLLQILRNLLSNAMKFTKQGSVTLTAAMIEDEVLPIRISVSDTGIGIPEDKLELIFNEFQQVDGSISREFGGTGLGLSISKKFAELINGKVSVESKEGEGSTFTVHLPGEMEQEKAPTSVDARDYAEAEDDDRAELRDEGRPILLIDDDSDFCKAVIDINRQNGCKTVTAHSGKEGLKMATKYHPAGIILDLGLPDMDGVDLLARLKKNAQTKAIPVYVVSGRDKDEALLKQGALEYLQKPVTSDDITDMTHAILQTISSGVKSILVYAGETISYAEILELAKAMDTQVIDMSDSEASLELIGEQEKLLAIVDAAPSKGAMLDICAELRSRWPDISIVIGAASAPDADDEAAIAKFTDTVIVKSSGAQSRLIENIEHFLRTASNQQLDPARPNPVHADQKVLKGSNILVADDDARNLFVITSALEEHGARVVDAVNGNSALKKLKEEQFDLILMDIMMPEMDGYEAISKIRADDALKDIPIIVLTAKALKEDREKCLQIGANDYLSKPVEYERLIKLSHAWIEKGR
ncbi:hypothetical protein Ga0123461_2194 [Mariprofundus aestuarium]|uniref:histidine kinase n=1 Tax=Mariprofundus aestuarium TaxID=1921086 RepID=A0A2K8L2Z7_MARES|nr:response regulator [Mariprofundus aestuarium]ATX80599.1 hypothetical protein Ga0123461_2194 [Mariprofundus aestuarium]